MGGDPSLAAPRKNRSWIRLAAFLVGFFVVLFVIPMWVVAILFDKGGGYEDVAAIPLALGAGIQELEDLGVARPVSKGLCRQPLSRVREKHANHEYSPWQLEKVPPTNPPTYESCIHPMRDKSFGGCATWRGEYCVALAIHQFVLSEPAILNSVLRAIENPCDFLNHPKAHEFEEYYRLRFYGKPIRRAASLPIPPWKCTEYRSRVYVIHVVDDDRKTIMRMRITKDFLGKPKSS